MTGRDLINTVGDLSACINMFQDSVNDGENSKLTITLAQQEQIKDWLNDYKKNAIGDGILATMICKKKL